MKSSKLLLAFLTLSLSAIFCGCTTTNPNDTAVPWDRPSNWEGGIPGMGSPDQDGPH